MALIQACPENQNEVIEASRKLGCSYDKYGNNQYLCLPNEEKTSLIEFCSDGVMGIRDKGICLEVKEGYLMQHNCNNFSDGCPETEFYDYDFYKYPACQNINTELHCYVADPLCGPKPSPFLEESFNFYPIVYTLGGLLFFATICIIVWCRWRRNCRKENPKAENDAEMKFLSNDPKAANDAEMEFLQKEQLAQTVPNKTNTNTFNDESRQFNTPQEEYSRESTDGGLQTTRDQPNPKTFQATAPGSPQMAHSRYPSGVNEITVKKGKAISLSSADEKASSPKSNVCSTCSVPIRGSYVSALNKTWCPEHFVCHERSCGQNLLNNGFVEKDGALYCEKDYEQRFAPTCARCRNTIKETYLIAIQNTYHPDCFKCFNCWQPIDNNHFYLEDDRVYCEKDWRQMFQTCNICKRLIEDGDLFAVINGNKIHVKCHN